MMHVKKHIIAEVTEGFRVTAKSLHLLDRWRECIYWGTCTQSLQHLSLSLSVTHAVVMLFFFFFNKPLRGNHRVNIQYSQALQHTQTHTSSLYGLYKGWVRRVRREPFPRKLSSSMPLNEWPSVTNPHTWRQRPATTIHFPVQRCSQL